jgi:hypothetical protein
VADATPGPIPSAISAAIESNIALQDELHRRLLQIKRKKEQNRREAERVLSSMLSHSRSCPSSSSSSSSSTNGDPNRKWMRRYFIDKDGSTPYVSWGNNELHDGKEEHGIDDTMQSDDVLVFERNIESRRSSSSTDEPQQAWKKVKRENWKNNSLVEVAIKRYTKPELLPQQQQSKECLVPCFTFVDTKMSKTKLTKQECNFIISMVDAYGGKNNNYINWYELAKKHYNKFNKQTPWQCFTHYRSIIHNPVTMRCPPWTPDEDELLLKYLAIQGPQFLLQGDAAVQTCITLFPHRNTRQVIARAQSTLINPNYIHDAWTTDEKRQLALLMRVYSKEHNPLALVSHMEHFTRRAPKSVAEKWIRTLNPALSPDQRNMS